MGPGTTSRRIGPALCALLVLAIVPIAALAGGGDEPTCCAIDPREDRAAGSAGLRPFDSCAAVGRYARRHSEAVTFPGGVAGTPVGGDGAGPPGATAPGAGGAESDGSGSTGTNVQEPGIDEPDILKASGSLVFAIARGELRAIDGAAADPAELGSLDLAGLPGNAAHGWDHQLLLSGDRLLLITQTYGGDDGASPGGPGIAAPDIAYFGSPRTVLTEIDVSDPAAMSVVRSLRVEGGFVDARMSGGTARLVISSYPDYPFASEGVARKGVRRLIPNLVIRDHATGDAERRRLLPCRELRRPRSFSGLELLSVLTIDLTSGIDPTDVDSLMTQGNTVYGSAESLYVATERWLPPDATEKQASAVTTEIHKFALGSPTETEHVASGAVPGFMLSQWALSEQDGYLRVASTSESPDFEIGERESFVTVLDQEGRELEEVGSVGGLGRGERIYSVRFIGDVGYVVTFRQVDPLYTLDLSDPTAPRTIGELKVPGYSAYLHPVGDGLLLGVGQDATEQGRTRGTQVSLFDVTDLAAPSALDQVALGEGTSSEVEYDHHAFLLDPATGLTVIPLEDYGGDGPPFAGAIGFRVGPLGIDEVARISHPDSGDAGGEMAQASPVRRSLISGGRLLTLSEAGLMASSPADLSEQGFLAFD